jgi:multidrug efflux system membrane fusion protein
MTGTSRKSSILIATAIALALAVWMLSGIGTAPESAGDERAVGREAVEGGERPMRVLVVRSAARTIPSVVELSARTEPNRRVELRVETEGRVVELGADRGARVESGAAIATLDMRERAALLTEAEALIEQSQLQYEAALELKDQQFVSDTQIAETRARVATAEAARERILLDIDRTGITAPFTGLLQERYVELGDYVQAGDEVAELVDTDPIIVVADVSEKHVTGLSAGGKGHTEIGGKSYSGTIRYLAPVAATETRTFRVELAVANPDNEIKAGMTARLAIAAGEIRAHTLSPALLTLADDGTIGVKTVDEFDRVRFYPVTIEGATDDGVTITGLPDVASVISVGQGFVVDGQSVIPVQNEADLSRTDDERAY